MKALEAEKNQAQKQVDQLDATLEKLNAELEEQQENYNEYGENVAVLRKEMQSRAKILEDTRQEMNEDEQNILRCSRDKAEILQKCRLEEIQIPLAEDSAPLSALPVSAVAGRDPDDMEMDDEDEAPVHLNDYGIQIDYEGLDYELKEDNSNKVEDDLNKVVDDLTAELEKMAPNMRATDRLEGVEAKARTAEKDLDRARREWTRAKADFEDVKNQRLEAFNKAFNYISGTIDSVYKSLTKNEQTQMGGSAYVSPRVGLSF